MDERAIRWGWLLFASIGAAGCRAPDGPAPYRLQPLVQDGSRFHGIHGLRFDDDGTLYAVSVIGQSIFTVDPDTGSVDLVVGPPQGMADDIAIAADGTLVWTAIEDGVLYVKPPNGPVRRRVENVKGANAISFSRDGERLFFTLVFYGDALYELDLEGTAPPRLIAENIGGLNAFQAADDGMIYGPLVFGGRVVRIDPDSGAMTTVSDEFESPGALKLDFEGSAYVLDGAALKRVELATGATAVVAQLPSDGDNLAIDSNGQVFVSLSAEDAILEVDPETGGMRYVLGPAALDSPAGLAVAADGGHDTLYVGDLFGGLRVVNGETGEVADTPVDIFQPTHVSVRDGHVIAVGEVFGEIQRLDRATFDVLDSWEGFEIPHDALEAANGDLVVAETGAGRVVRVTGRDASDRQVIADGLDEPTGLAWAGERAVYVTETGGGRLLHIDLATGETVVEASQLERPEGVAVDSEGGVLVVEVGARRLRRFQPGAGTDAVVADDLPIGWADGPSLYRGVAASASAIYLTSDVKNTIYKLVR